MLVETLNLILALELKNASMPQKYVYILFFILGTFPLLAQPNSIRPKQNNDVNSLVKDIFIRGNCKNVSNIESSGDSISFGEFSNAGNIISIPDGIILSTGDVEDVVGPNESVETTTSFVSVSNDKDLVRIATNQLFDVTVLEFDFVPLADQVSFQYVFASEEYCEFVGTIFNDVFGFFVSGPGIDGPFENGAINVAKIPNSNEFVSINNVNHILNTDFYVQNELLQDADQCGLSFNPSHSNSIEFDGFTTPLVARFDVIPCETYHIRLVVGDVGDDKLDSAVFLRSKSFNLGELATVKAVVPNRSDTIAYENCADGQFVFTRPNDSNRNLPYPVDFVIGNNSTATEGLDFQAIETSIIIPAGQNTATLPIQTLVDEETENIETLTIDLQQICQCEGGSEATLKIADVNTPELVFPKIDACANQSFTLTPQLREGVSPFNYEWSDGTADSSLTDLITQSTTYKVTVTDFCQNSTVDSLTVNIQDIPTASLSGAIDYCEGLPMATLPLNFAGNAPWSFTYTIDDSSPIIIDNILNSDFNLPINTLGTYKLIAFTDAGCTGIASGMGLVHDIGLEVDYEIMPPSCPNLEDGQIELLIRNGQAPFAIEWSSIVNNPMAPTQLASGNYSLTIIDAQQCLFSTSINLPNSTVISPNCVDNAVYIPNSFSPNGDGINDFFEIFLAKNTTVQRVIKVEIKDRWGNLVYAVKNTMPNWDGQFKGQLLDPAVFRYSLILETNNNQTESYQGDVSLVR